MADRRLPYARTLAVLRVLSWPYRYPPLSWLSAFIDWIAGSKRRFVANIIVCLLVIVGATVWEVTRG
ncbi:hypothetical protein [Plantactinospora sp. WMMB782]|uniref:hypothetical protein n=1 Tax=Plantactinospora sp. WMMB782 TaxID=3404121 RepID=UPI003B94DE86